MEIRIISVGKIREKHFRTGIDEYLKRIRTYMRVTLVEGLEERISPRARENEQQEARRKEGERILALVKDNEIIVVFDLHGQGMTSEKLAQLVQGCRLTGKSRLNLVIGGATGLAEEVKNRAHHLVSLSLLTFPHQMATLIVAEQVYRALTMVNSHPYHK